MRTLVIDNYDSFVWNLAHAIALANGVEPLVVRNDACSWEELWARGPFDNIVISPGPGTVERASDLGVARRAIELAPVPVLGVCLGHQGIAHVHGGTIRHAEPVHGRVSRIRHDGDELFENIPSPWSVVRYHSLVVTSPLPEPLQVIAHSEDGLVMALRHRERPLWGVQFHPESILTEHGRTLITNFRDITQARCARTNVAVPTAIELPSRKSPPPARQVTTRSLPTTLSAEDLFVGLYADATHAFWLDSAAPTGESSRFSILGAPDAGDEDAVRVHRRGDSRADAEFLAALEADLARPSVGGESLPLPFRGGWVGYFGYEMPFGEGTAIAPVVADGSELPDAVWLRADRFIVFDHTEQRVHLAAVSAANDIAVAEEWLAATQERIEQLVPAASVVTTARMSSITLELEQSRTDYLASIEVCKQVIRDGESYEINLTNRFQLTGELDGLAFYRVLRQVNPAPFAAYLRAGTYEVLCASPERFLRVNAEGRVAAQPIKGTSHRDPDPARDRVLAERLQGSEKNRAENLMIVDLLRNDLSRVAMVGSVEVPELMYVETYATVHHLLSTITAQLEPSASLIDLLRAAFPGGSVTGAPKIRTMQLIESLERSARGVYCGSIGYLGYNRVADLNIAIRTLTYDGTTLKFGAGGAITQLSDSAEEYAEMLLKADALIRPLCRYLAGDETAAYHLVSPSASKEPPCTAG